MHHCSGAIVSFVGLWECTQTMAPSSSASIGTSEQEAFPGRLSMNVEDLEKAFVSVSDEKTGSNGEVIEEGSGGLGIILVEGSE